VCTVSATGSVVAVGAGNCVVTADQPGNNDWAAATPQATWTIAIDLQPQTITFNPPATATVGATATLSATSTGSATIPVVFTVAPASAAVCAMTTATQVQFNAAGNCVINANKASDGATYAAAPQVQKTIAVGKQSQTINFPAQTPKTYAPTAPGNTFALNPATAPGGAVTYTSLTPLVCSVNSATAMVTILKAGTCTIAADQGGDATAYMAAPQVRQDITINKADQTVTITSTPPATAVAGGQYTVTASSTSGLTTFTFTAGPASVCTNAGAVVTFAGKGDCVVGVVQSGNENYNAGSASQTISGVLNKQTLTVTTAPKTPVAVGDTYTITVAGAVGTLTYAIDPASTSGACTIAGNVVTFTATTGTCIVIADAAGTTDYAPAQTRQTIILDAVMSSGATAVPTLGEWMLALLAALTALLALPALRRRAAAVRR